MRIRILSLLAAILFTIGFTGCNSPKETEVALAIVVGSHSNSMDIPVNSGTIKDALYDSCYSYGSVSFTYVDGNPKMYYRCDIPEPEVSGLSSSKKQSIANGYVNQLLNQMKQAKPVVSEVDTLKAVRQAAMSIADVSDNQEKVMIIMDSGLSTVGYLDFTKGFLNADTDSIVEALRQAEALPDMNNIRVLWMYSGQTAYPQKELSERQKNKLKDIWSSVLIAGGAKEVIFTSDIASESTDNTYPIVSIVDVEEQKIDWDDENWNIIDEPIDTIVLDSAYVNFIGNKAEFKDYDMAVESLENVAEQLISYSNNKMYVIGTTASGDKDFCQQLSVDRAEAVKNILVSYGVKESQLITVGLGFEDPWHVEDIDDNGRQISDKASQNRKVLIVDVNGEDASLLEY